MERSATLAQERSTRAGRRAASDAALDRALSEGKTRERRSLGRRPETSTSKSEQLTRDGAQRVEPASSQERGAFGGAAASRLTHARARGETRYEDRQKPRMGYPRQRIPSRAKRAASSGLAERATQETACASEVGGSKCEARGRAAKSKEQSEAKRFALFARWPLRTSRACLSPRLSRTKLPCGVCAQPSARVRLRLRSVRTEVRFRTRPSTFARAAGANKPKAFCRRPVFRQEHDERLREEDATRAAQLESSSR